MVARGDLGVEMLPQEVPIAQKRIVFECNRRGIPVIVATQMLESMIQSPRPTRAEVSGTETRCSFLQSKAITPCKKDVCNAIFDGADACMLSGETASGAFPVEAVKMMSDIAITAKANPDVDTSLAEQDTIDKKAFTKSNLAKYSVGAAAVAMAKSVGSKAIVVFTYSGRSALSVARHRPNIPVIAFTRSEEVARHLVLSRNVIPFVADEFHTIVEIGEYATKFVKREGIVQPGESFVLTASHPLLHTHLPNNFVKIVEVE